MTVTCTGLQLRSELLAPSDMFWHSASAVWLHHYAGFNLCGCLLWQGNELPGQEKCSADSYVILPHKSKYVDQQTLKLQVMPSGVL